MRLSNNSSQSIEQVAKGAKGQFWWQFYPWQDMGASQEFLERAQGAGYTAIVITVGQQASYYERSQHVYRNLGARVGGAGDVVDAGGAAGAGRQGGADRGNDPEALGTAALIGRRQRVAVRRHIASAAAVLLYSLEYLDQVRKFIKPPIIIKGIVTARGRAPLRRARLQRHRRVESRWPIYGLRSVDAGGAAGDRCGSERKNSRDDRQRLSAAAAMC